NNAHPFRIEGLQGGEHFGEPLLFRRRAEPGVVAGAAAGIEVRRAQRIERLAQFLGISHSPASIEAHAVGADRLRHVLHLLLAVSNTASTESPAMSTTRPWFSSICCLNTARAASSAASVARSSCAISRE